MFAGVPWWGKIILLIVIALVAVFLFQNIVLPLLNKVT